MKESTIKWNTPTMPSKIKFYNSLVEFYHSVVNNPAITLNDEQMRAISAIDEFENGNIHIHYKYDIRCLDENVVRTLTPKHHRKRSLYRILVAFFDATLSYADHKCCEDNMMEDNESKDIICAVCASIPTDLKGLVFVAVLDNVQSTTEKIEKRKKMRKFKVSLNRVYTYKTEVYAECEEDAERIALKNAEYTDKEDWAYNYYDGCYITDEDEN